MQELAEAVTKKVTKEATEAATKKVTKEAVEAATKKATKEITGELAEKVIKEGTEKVIKEGTEKGIKEGAEAGAKNSLSDATKIVGDAEPDSLAKSIAKDVDQKDIKKITDEATGKAEKELLESTKPSLKKRITQFVKDNPGTTLGGAMAVGLGGFGLANALKSYSETNGKSVNITCTFPTNDNPTSYFSCPNSNSPVTKSLDNGDIVIRFEPELKIVDGDSITFSGTNFSPPIDGTSFDVNRILSPSCVIINIPNIVQFANTGTFTLKTSTSARMLDQASTALEKTGGAVGELGNAAGSGLFKGLDNLVGGSLSSFLNGSMLLYCGIVCALICCCIVFLFIMLVLIK